MSRLMLRGEFHSCHAAELLKQFHGSLSVGIIWV